jgi:4-hydroxy-tetrahydrodipicolinate reductase
MVKYFNKLGIEFNEKDIKMIREPGAQLKLGVPENFLGGHGWHRYTINPLFSNRTEAIRNFANMFESAFLTENNPALKGYKFQRGAWENSATSADGNVYIGTINLENGGIILEHNINGRGVYVDGTLNLAVPHLARMIGRGEKGKVYSMIDVLKG